MNNRVETATKLYHAASNENEWNNRFNVESTASRNAMYELMHIIGSFERSNYARFIWVFRELGDLIDPKCKPMITVDVLTESLTKYTSECSECGAIFGDFPTREQAETTHPTYCPCCGSRVITPNSGKDNDSEC